MAKKTREYHVKMDLRAFYAPIERPVMYGELPSIDMPSIGKPSCASELVVCSFPPRKSFSMAAIHADIIKRGIYVSLPQTMDEVKRDLDSILSQQPLIPSLSDAKKLAGSLLPNHLNAKTK